MRPLLVAALVVTASVVGAEPAGAVTISPDVFTDDVAGNGNCTLREAVIAANTDMDRDLCPAGNGSDVITLQAGTYTLSIDGVAVETDPAADDLDLSGTLAIDGPAGGATIDQLSAGRRLIQVLAAATVTLSDLTITGGDPLQSGGGIFNQGSLGLDRVTVTGNSSQSAHAGGILNTGTSLSIVDSVVSGNSAAVNSGGGIRNESSGTVTITDTTIGGASPSDGNTAMFGGGIFTTAGTLTITNSTISENGATDNSGGVAVFGGTANLTGSTVTGNDSASSGGGLLVASGATLTVTNSTISGNSGGTAAGGGISNIGTLSLSNSTISDNFVTASGAGGISNTLATSVTTIQNSTISGNSAEGATSEGGGIRNFGMLAITNSTISGNRADSSGGGIFQLGASSASTLSNVTVTENTADDDIGGGGDGGGVARADGTMTLRNTIIAGNTDASAGNEAPDCSGTVTANHYNLIGNDSMCTGVTGTDIGDQPADLGPLAVNGGPTLTHVPQAGSQAIDAGNPAGCTDGIDPLPTDQRGVSRVDGDGLGAAECDIGAAEAAYTLAITATGQGTVTGPSINCGVAPGASQCTQDYPIDTPVSLTGMPGGNSYLKAWGADCTPFGSGATCQITMDQNHSVTAEFAPVLIKSLTLTAKPKRVERGDRTRLKAMVSPCEGHEGDIVQFFRGDKLIAQKTTNDDCVAVKTWRITQVTRFHAYSPQQDADHTDAFSAEVKVKLKKD